jgi:hypothetical protein
MLSTPVSPGYREVAMGAVREKIKRGITQDSNASNVRESWLGFVE